MLVQHHSLLTLALIAASTLSGNTALAVRVNPDGHGQALIYPYYTARSTASGNTFVTAFSVTNITGSPKAVRVRILEGKAGREVLDFNLFLAAHDVWTAGIIPAGIGAGLFSKDNSCTSPQVGTSPALPLKFRNGAYAGDQLGDGLDRTYEGFFEMVEMGVIDAASALGRAVTPVSNHAAPNASRPSCAGLSGNDDVPAGLSRPTGGLFGNASYINVNEGTDFSVDALALSQWSDKVQWSVAGKANPNLSDASPAVSLVLDSSDESDLAYITQWNRGRDAVTALLMVDRVANDFTVEPWIKAATDWILTLPTKRFHVSRALIEPPFKGTPNDGHPPTNDSYYCESTSYQRYVEPLDYFDRETQSGSAHLCEPILDCTATRKLCGSASAVTFSENYGSAFASRVLHSTASRNIALNGMWINGWAGFAVTATGGPANGPVTPVSQLISPPGQTTIVDTQTGIARTGQTVTYFGLPIVGFSAQSYSTHGLSGVNPNVLSNYGGQFGHKFTRRMEVAP